MFLAQEHVVAILHAAMLNFYHTLLLFTNYELAEEIERQVKAI